MLLFSTHEAYGELGTRLNQIRPDTHLGLYREETSQVGIRDFDSKE
jgi:hypothetical protein